MDNYVLCIGISDDVFLIRIGNSKVKMKLIFRKNRIQNRTWFERVDNLL